MTEKTIKEYTKNWFRFIVEKAEKMQEENPALVLRALLNDLKNYIDHLDSIDSNRGRGTSERKKLSSALNGKKGGWKKGVPRKKPESATETGAE